MVFINSSVYRNKPKDNNFAFDFRGNNWIF